MKKIIYSILVMAIVFSSVLVPIRSFAAKTYANWSEAYKDFILNREYLHAGQDYFYYGKGVSGHEPMFALHDIDSDSIPELVVEDGLFHPACTIRCNVYKFKNSSIQYIGEYTANNVEYIDGETEFTGLFLPFIHTGSFNYEYGSIGSDGKCMTEVVVYGSQYPEEGEEDYDGTIRIGEKTDNDDLYNAFCNSTGCDPEKPFDKLYDGDGSSRLKSLEFFALVEMEFIDWDSFCSEYGFSARDAEGKFDNSISDPAGVILKWNEGTFDDDIKLVVESKPEQYNTSFKLGGDYERNIYDIYVVDGNGNRVQPRNGRLIELEITVDESLNGKYVLVIHYLENALKEYFKDVKVANNKIKIKTNHFSEFVVYEVPDIGIENFKSSFSADYKSKLTFNANITDVGESNIHWFVNGKDVQTGSAYTIDSAVEKEYTVQIKVIVDGETVSESEVETVKVKTNFFAKLIAFFRGLFGKLPEYVDNFKVK